MTILRQCIYATVLLSGLVKAEETTTPVTPSVIRKDLLTASIDSGKSIAKIEIKEVILGPGLRAPLHLHPCPVVGVVTEGTVVFQIEGDAVQHLKAGDAFYEPANKRVARFDNEGDTPAKFSAFYLLGKDEHELIRMLPK